MEFENEEMPEELQEKDLWEEFEQEDVWEEEVGEEWEDALEENEETLPEEADMDFQDFSVQEGMQMLPEELRLVQRAQEIVRKQEQQEADRFMEKEFLALQKEFPDCGLNEVGDLLETAEGKKALQLWKSMDIPLADAYAATHRVQLRAKQHAAIRQGVLNQLRSKQHLTQTRGGQERMEMPADVRAEFKKYFPNASDKEIERMYRKNQEKE